MRRVGGFHLRLNVLDVYLNSQVLAYHDLHQYHEIHHDCVCIAPVLV